MRKVTWACLLSSFHLFRTRGVEYLCIFGRCFIYLAKGVSVAWRPSSFFHMVLWMDLALTNEIITIRGLIIHPSWCL